MIKKIASMVLVFLMCITLGISASEQKTHDDDVQEPPLKKTATSTSTAISIDLSARDSRKELVVKLDLSFNDHLDNLSFILSFPNLKDLNLFCCKNLKDSYRTISQLTNLERLNLHGTCLTTAEYLQPLVKLQSLNIYIPSLATGIEYLTHLKLKELDITGDDYVSLTGLSRLTSLESLMLTSFYREERVHGDPDFPSLDFITPLVNLRSLRLPNNTFITHIKPIVTLHNLTHLDLTGCHYIVDLKCVSELKDLIELDIRSIGDGNITTITEDLSSLTSLSNLRKLTIDEKISIPENIPSIVKVIKKK